MRDVRAITWGAGIGGLENLETWRLELRPGSQLDVLDTVEKWCEASVVSINMEKGLIKITYTYWSDKVCLTCTYEGYVVGNL